MNIFDALNEYQVELFGLMEDITSLYYALDRLPASKRNNRFYRGLLQVGRKNAVRHGLSATEHDNFIRCVRRTFDTAQTMPEEERLEYFLCEILAFIDNTTH